MTEAGMNRMTKAIRLDFAVLSILAIGAGCGLVYEYLLSHYAGRVLGVMDVAIFGIISVMMVFMGLGSFLVRGVKNPYAAFAWLEIALALVGSTSVLLIGGLFALSGLFPKILMDTFGLTADLAPSGSLVATLHEIARLSPYLVGALLGTLIGMEIPLICEIRSEIHKKRSQEQCRIGLRHRLHRRGCRCDLMACGHAGHGRFPGWGRDRLGEPGRWHAVFLSLQKKDSRAGTTAGGPCSDGHHHHPGL
jgi:predicted membrane-bound spermidine synthase